MYARHLKELLRPMGLYQLDHGLGSDELEAIGAQLDTVLLGLEETEREGMAVTARDWGLEGWEEILPTGRAYLGVADRRGAVEALMRINGASFTPEAINSTLAGCGISALAQETDEAGVVLVSFPHNRGVPDSFEDIKAGIEAILPCHLGIEYSFVYACWLELETLLTWLGLETACPSWDQVEKYTPGEAAA